MKRILILIAFQLGQLCFANMASPIQYGTYSSAPFTSKQIDIVKEKIKIAIADDSQTATYTIDYFIQADSSGLQIPFLFHAMDYKGDFEVWIDNEPVSIRNLPGDRISTEANRKNIISLFSLPEGMRESESITIYYENNVGLVCKLSDLKYFEADIQKGTHRIRVQYTAAAWIDSSNWVKEFQYIYSLSPAKSWRSFGSLEIEVQTSEGKKLLSTNLGSPETGSQSNTALWNFAYLPADYIKLTLKPQIPALAATLIYISPEGLAILFSLLIALFHYLFLRYYKKQERDQSHSWIVNFGSFVAVFLFLFSYLAAYEFIDMAIGEDASRQHGYIFFVYMLYPFILVPYWLFMKLMNYSLSK
jgi:hypothetical protein